MIATNSFINSALFSSNMRTDYLIYPQAIELLEKSGLSERVNELKESDEGIPHIGIIFEDQIVSAVNYLKNEGYYRHLPKEFSKEMGLKYSEFVISK